MTRNRTTRLLTNASVDRIVPMGAQLRDEASMLTEALPKGILAVQDPKRTGFYSVECQGSELYIHLHEPRRTAYVLARLPTPEKFQQPLSTVEPALSGCST